MNRELFEKKVLELWMESRVPLTLINVQYHTKASRSKTERWLDELVREDVLEMIVSNHGDVLWKVRGARRPLHGPVTFDEWKQRRGPDSLHADLERAAGSASTALVLDKARSALRSRPEGGKSYAWSAGLSLVLGPLGWLYAGAWREAIPASALFLFIGWLLPTFLLLPIFGVALPICAVVGLLYAFKYNKHGARRAIVYKDQT